MIKLGQPIRLGQEEGFSLSHFKVIEVIWATNDILFAAELGTDVSCVNAYTEAARVRLSGFEGMLRIWEESAGPDDELRVSAEDARLAEEVLACAADIDAAEAPTSPWLYVLAAAGVLGAGAAIANLW